MTKRFENTKLSVHGKIVVTLDEYTDKILEVEVIDTEFRSNWLTLGYIMGNKTVHSSSCFGRDFNKNKALAMLTDEAFVLFDMMQADTLQLKALQYIEI